MGLLALMSLAVSFSVSRCRLRNILWGFVWETTSGYVSGFVSSSGHCSRVSLRVSVFSLIFYVFVDLESLGRFSLLASPQEYMKLYSHRETTSPVKPGHSSTSPWYPAVTCLVSASLEEYRNFWTSGGQRCSTVDTRSCVSLRGCAYAKVTGYHFATSSCSSGGMPDLRAFAAALEATPVSV